MPSVYRGRSMRSLRLTIIIIAAHALFSCVRKNDQAEGLDTTAMKALAQSGDGFVVWERLRDDEWQIWRKPLAGGEEKLLVPTEQGRDHLCPKLSPDGKKLAYLSLKHSGTDYDDSPGTLWLMDLGNGKCERLIEGARNYHENRAVVWFDDQRLCYVDANGDATELDLRTREQTKLTSKSHPRGGWLVDRTRRHATTGEPEFAPFDAGTGEIHSTPRHGGCQPYFSADGKWGYWMGGAGGPLNAMFLPTRQTSIVLELNDPRLPSRQNYIYFPMLSDSMRLMAFAASDDDHDHFTSNYDIFIVRMDPGTLEPIGKPVRFTSHAGTDRYPDVWQRELALGTHFAEGAADLTIKAPEERKLHWFVDGLSVGEGPELKHHFGKKGDHWIEGRDGNTVFTGLVHIRRAYPPYVTMVRHKESDRLHLTFSEEVSLKNARAEGEDGQKLSLSDLSAEGHVCEVQLQGGVKSVTLSGVQDLSQHPNMMKPERLDVPPLVWPQSRQGLIFAWDNKHTSPVGVKAPTALERTGKAFWNSSGGLDTRGGSAVIPGLGNAVASACAKTHAITVEALIRPLVPPYDKQMRPIFSLETEAGEVQFRLSQRISMLVLQLATADEAKGEAREHLLAQVRSGSTYHFIIGYEDGRLSVFLNGSEIWVRPMVIGKLKVEAGNDTFSIGGSKNAATATHWPGTVEHLAIYDRMLAPTEAMGHCDLMAPLLAQRSKERQQKVKAKLLEASHVPTLQEITPYREALMTCLYEVLPKDQERDRQELPPGTRIAVTHWVWVNGERAKEVPTDPGEIVDLFLDPIAQHAEIKGLVIRNDLKPDAAVEEFLDASNW